LKNLIRESETTELKMSTNGYDKNQRGVVALTITKLVEISIGN